MREGLRLFTSYTNNWKKELSKEYKRSELAKPQSIQEIFNKVSASPNKWTNVRNRSTERKYVPNLPKPIFKKKDNHIIRFSKLKEEIEIASEFLFEDENISASKVGEACFDYILRIAQEK
jgi:hypothetical protein